MHKQLAKRRVAMAVQPAAPIFELSLPCEVFGIDRSDIQHSGDAFQVCATSPATKVVSGLIPDQVRHHGLRSHAEDTGLTARPEPVHQDSDQRARDI
jgi:hypothetical protein